MSCDINEDDKHILSESDSSSIISSQHRVNTSIFERLMSLKSASFVFFDRIFFFFLCQWEREFLGEWQSRQRMFGSVKEACEKGRRQEEERDQRSGTQSITSRKSEKERDRNAAVPFISSPRY